MHALLSFLQSVSQTQGLGEEGELLAAWPEYSGLQAHGSPALDQTRPRALPDLGLGHPL